MLIKTHLFFFSLVAVGLLSVTNGQSIDQMIAASMESLKDFDFFEDINGNVVKQELDMLLLKDQYDALTSKGGRKKRKAVKSTRYRWPDSTIPYKIAPNVFSSNDKKLISAAMKEWSDLTCVKFRQANSRDNNFIYFNNGGGCSSYVGMVGGSQQVTLARGCRHKGIIIHEIGHAVGFHHEQNRPDRDQFIEILFQNIPQSVRYNFKKYSSAAVDVFDVPYDFTSVMHYGGKAFSNNNGYTIRTRDRRHQKTIGNRSGLSYYDVMMANRMYKCDKKCSTQVECSGNSYRGKDCKCYCKGNPVVKECGGTTNVKTTTTTTTTRAITRTTPTTKCMDANKASCPHWAKSPEDYCTTNTYVKTYCKESCGTCDDSGVSSTCTDKKPSGSCLSWARLGYCKKYFVEYMKSNCRKTCDLCTEEDIIENTNGAVKSHALYLVMVVVLVINKIFY